MTRRDFMVLCTAASFGRPAHASAPWPVQYRREPSWAAVLPFAEPGSDEFPGEKTAMEIEARLAAALASGDLPAAGQVAGASPCPREYRHVTADVKTAVFQLTGDPVSGWNKWRRSLGDIHAARFYRLPGDIVRFEVSSTNAGKLEYRVGLWKQVWEDGQLRRFEPVEETVTSSDTRWFEDVTGAAFENVASFREQLARGTPYWRARLDSACGIDVYGSNGISVADIDGDGLDEIYVCQPGGLPNRLYKNDGRGRLHDISKAAGLDILDDTSSALFVDLRNSGHQDVVVVHPTRPLLFLNDGRGRFTLVPNAFRFASEPQGTFTSVAAADYDRDGRLDLYLCTYVYFQSEAQYRYASPYHDAQNGPPNFLFHNRLNDDGGYFEDVTEACGINANNNRFSFAAAWCDYNGDGWPDLFVANDFGRKNLYRNTNGHFHDAAAEAGTEDVGPGMSAAWFDYDGDGRPDLLVSNMWSASGQRVTQDAAFGPVKRNPSLRDAYRRHTKGNSLYRNLGDGTFRYTGNSEGIEMARWAWSADGHDFDNDGNAEIFTVCGMLTNNSERDLMSYFWRQVVSKSPLEFAPAPAYENGWNAINQLIREDYSWSGREPNVVYARRGDRFHDFSGVSGLDVAEDGRAFAVTDIDGDGNLDIVLKSRLGPQLRVFRNACTAGRKSIAFSLRGTESNRDAIGAKLEADRQTKWIAAGSGYLSQHTKRVHFGLADRDRVEKLRITWPSGKVQEFTALSAGRCYEIVEGSAELRSKPFADVAHIPPNVPLPPVDNRSRLYTTWLREPVPLPDKRPGPAIFVVHAGDRLPALPVRVEMLDLRASSSDTVAAYAIFRRYLFDYRCGLEPPLWLLIDGESRVRKVYADAPDAAAAVADLRSLDTPVPDVRALPFDGFYVGHPRRDYYKIGAALLAAGYNDHALPYLEETLRRSPENARTLLAIGRIHLEAGRLPEARAALQRATTLDPLLPEAWNELGGVEAVAGNFSDALRLYERAIALSPEFPYSLTNAAQMHEKLGHPDEAERLYRRALASDPRSGDAANGLGLLLAKQGHTSEARDLFERAISIRRDNASAINNLAVLYLNTGQTNDAIAALRYGIQVAPDEDILYLNLARTWVRMGERDKARETMRQLLARKPGYAVAENALKELDTR